MGRAFVVVAGRHGDNAAHFYRMCPAASVLPSPQVLHLPNVQRVPNPSLNSLLRAILRFQDQEILIVSHGSHTQLAMPVIPGVNIGVDLRFIQEILGPNSNADLAQWLGTRERVVVTLRANIQNVQQLGLRRLEFRACRIGQSRPMLVALKRLFGAGSVCAPRSFDGYGRCNVDYIDPPTPNSARPNSARPNSARPNSARLTHWLQDNPINQTFGTSPNRFFWVNSGDVDPPKISQVFAESWDGLRAWIEAKFPAGDNNRFRGGTFYYHIQTSMLRTSSSVHGRRTFTNNFVFPNDPEYRQNLVRVT